MTVNGVGASEVPDAFCMLAAPESPAGEPVPMLALHADPDEREVLLLEDGTDWDEIGELVTESYRILAPKKLSALLP